MTAGHTPGPWYVWHGYAEEGTKFTCIETKDGEEVLGEHARSEVNARRIVACVNACEGISNEMLEQRGMISVLSRKSLNDRCLTVLERAEKKLNAYVGLCSGDKELTDAVLPMVRNAIANIKGGAA